MLMCVHVYMDACKPIQKSKETGGFSIAQVTGSCKPLDNEG